MYLVFFNNPNLLLIQTIQPINNFINLLFQLSRINPFILPFNNFLNQINNFLFCLFINFRINLNRHSGLYYYSHCEREAKQSKLNNITYTNLEFNNFLFYLIHLIIEYLFRDTFLLFYLYFPNHFYIYIYKL